MNIHIDPDEIVRILSRLDSDQVSELLVGPCRRCRGENYYFSTDVYKDVECDRCEMEYGFEEPTALALGIIKLIKDQEEKERMLRADYE